MTALLKTFPRRKLFQGHGAKPDARRKMQCPEEAGEIGDQISPHPSLRDTFPSP